MHSIRDLEKALEVRRYFNKMDFDEFAKLLKEDPKYDTSLFDPKEWKFTGLNNDHYLVEVRKDSIDA
jgi:hypothetical protein